MLKRYSLSLIQPITLAFSKLSLLQRMASNREDKRKLEEEAESSMERKRLWLSADDSGDDDSFDSPEEEIEEEVSSEVSSMKLDTSEEKLLDKRGCNMIFNDDGDTTSPSSEPRTPKSHRCFDKDDFWM
jgi:hypothetical protein